MEKALQTIRTLGWGSIVMGIFLLVKIPETLFSLMIFTRFEEDFTGFFFSGGMIALLMALVMLALILLIGGSFLLKKKRWAKNFLEFTYWVIVIVSIAQIGRIFGSVVMSFFTEGAVYGSLLLSVILLLPVAILTVVMIIGLFMIRKSDVSKLLVK